MEAVPELVLEQMHQSETELLSHLGLLDLTIESTAVGGRQVPANIAARARERVSSSPVEVKSKGQLLLRYLQ
jgi:hypothetical protein